MPIIIKRYANRKLYDTEKKRYVTLSAIAKYIQENEEILVIDKTTGEDISNLILTQIIIERERKNAGIFPKSLLAGLIKPSNDTFEFIKRSLSSPIELLRHVNEEIERRIDVLIDLGKITQEEGIYMRENLLSLGDQKTMLINSTESIISEILQDRGIPSRIEFNQLINEVDRLSEIIDQYAA